MKLYIAASFRHLHAVRLLQNSLRAAVPGIEILDWTELAAPPLGLTPAQRREWMDTDLSGEVFRFCEAACGMADLVVYFGQSGQDAGVEVGMARAVGVPVLGILGPLEAPGLMLHGAVGLWVRDITETIGLIRALVLCDRRDDPRAGFCAECPGEKLCNMAPAAPGREG